RKNESFRDLKTWRIASGSLGKKGSYLIVTLSLSRLPSKRPLIQVLHFSNPYRLSDCCFFSVVEISFSRLPTSVVISTRRLFSVGDLILPSKIYITPGVFNRLSSSDFTHFIPH